MIYVIAGNERQAQDWIYANVWPRPKMMVTVRLGEWVRRSARSLSSPISARGIEMHPVVILTGTWRDRRDLTALTEELAPAFPIYVEA